MHWELIAILVVSPKTPRDDSQLSFDLRSWLLRRKMPVLRPLGEIPRAYRQTYKRAMSGKSRRAAANAFCLECVQWQREEIKLCTAIDYPLYPYRPYEK